MKMSQMYMPTLREVPTEAVAVSHQLLLRAGMIRKTGNGLFFYLPLGFRSFKKVENIVREEMDAIGSLECKSPVIVPGELWRETGRWDAMGDNLLRAKNRMGQELVVSPTNEESFTDAMRNELSSYKDYPLSVYHINIKYRDEIRPRYGIIRSREFTMKDAYSFHTNEECLDNTYQGFGRAYRKTFERCGLKVINVKADSGAMGGSGSEEFMVESNIGDNNLILCSNCGYAANDEKAACKPDPVMEGPGSKKTDKLPEVLETPDVKTIEELSNFLKSSPKAFIKTLIFRVENSELELKSPFVAACIRGDLDVNEVKLAAILKAGAVELALDSEVYDVTGTVVGFAGPIGLTKPTIVVDESVMAMHEAVTGALDIDKHYINVEPTRDFAADIVADIRKVKAGDICPNCGTPFYTKKGNELGHIFKLGKKYSKSMNMTYLDEKGERQHPTMGCYGIGVDRIMASAVEEFNDKDGIIWPMSIAPYQVVIIPIQYEGKMKEVAENIYDELTKQGIEALLDDRDERPGIKFKDMDLIGVPIRLVVGEKNLPKIECKLRSEEKTELVAVESVVEHVKTIVTKALAELKR